MVGWGTVQGVAFVPRRLVPAYAPLIPPALGILVNLALAAAFVWWFARRPVARGDRRRAATYRLRPVPRAAVGPLAALCAAVVAGVNLGLLVLPRFARMPSDRDSIVGAYLRRPWGPAAFLVLVALVAPLLEEFLFRGWLQRTLERAWPARRAILVTALLFAAVHLETFGFPLRFAFAVASGYAAWATGSIWPSVALHGLYNASLVAVGAFFPSLDERALARLAADDRVFWPALVGLALVVAVGAWAVRTLVAQRRLVATGGDRSATPVASRAGSFYPGVRRRR